MSTRTTEIDNTGHQFERTPLDPTLLTLQEDELAFFKEQTGITDVQKLRDHILEIQAEAYGRFPYPCIRRLTFTQLNIARLPEFHHVLEIGKNRAGAIMVDIGCCFGSDIRTVIAKGFPLRNMVGVDLRRDFWDLGHKLFNSTPETFPVLFIEGDIFASEMLDQCAPSYTTQATKTPSLLHLGNSLNSLQHNVSVIYAGTFFHLFSEDQQLEVARKFAGLLSPVAGSIMFGLHVGREISGIKTNTLSGHQMFCHSPETWCAMWDGIVFRKGSVNVRAALLDGPSRMSVETGQEEQGPDNATRWSTTRWLTWSVIRV